MDGRDAHLGPDARHVIDTEQREILDAVSNGERRIAVRSGHGVGKTTVLAWLIVWVLCVKFPLRCVCTAPTSGQLFDALYAEVITWLKKLPPALQELFEIKSESIHLAISPKESFAAFKTSRAETPEALAGVHAETGFVLLIGDEASGIAQAVFEAASGSMSGRNVCTILAGNPVRTAGLFFDCFHKLRDIWRTIHISCVGHRRIAPDFVEDMARRYGVDSNEYRVRVLGEFPKSELDTVIPFDLMEAALTRTVRPVQMRPVWGVDAGGAGKDNDRSALAKRQGNVLLEKVKAWTELETMQLVGRVKEEWDATPASMRPEEILVDSIGIGAGVADRLRELNLPARGINVSESPAMKEQFTNLKAELWWAAREWFQSRDCYLNGDEELGAELTGVRFLPPTSQGKTRIEPKADTKKHLKKSPDLADAFILTFASMAVASMFGSQMTTNWKTPLKRDIKGIV